MLEQVLGIVGGVLFAAGFVPYGYEALTKAHVRPNRATWLIWTINGFLIFFTYLGSTEAREAMWMPLAGAISPGVILIISWKHGEGGWSPFDRNCILGSVAILLGWWLTGWVFLAHVATLISDLFGLFPTLRKARLEPKGEDPIAWALWHAGTWANILAVIGASNWSPEDLTYPVYFWVGSGFMAYYVWRRR